MKEEVINGETYKLSGSLNKFQKELYVHLIDWKWTHITKDGGFYSYKGKSIEYDAILPKQEQSKLPLIYEPEPFKCSILKMEYVKS